MENFLLIIICVLILAIVIIASIARFMFGITRPYAMPPVTAGGHAMPPRGGGMEALIIVGLLVISLAYLSLREAPEVSNDYKQDTVSEEPYPIDIIPPRPNEEVFVNAPNLQSANLPQQTPEYQSHGEFANSNDYRFTLQLGAYHEEDNALAEIDNLAGQYDNIRLRVVDDQVPFKVVVGRFTTRKAAEQFARQHRIKKYFILELNK